MWWLFGLLLLIAFVRCFLFNFYKMVFYTVKDIYEYFKHKKWRNFNYYGIDMFVGMFGHGKTLSMTQIVGDKLYKKYGDSIKIISNYKLLGIPYTPLVNFNQLMQLGDIEEHGVKGYVVLIDEIEDLLSHSNFATFPLQLLNVLTQQRKKKIYIMCTAQRFFMVDKIFRSITTHVIDCHKYWRYAHLEYFDAWDYENAMNTKLV